MCLTARFRGLFLVDGRGFVGTRWHTYGNTHEVKSVGIFDPEIDKAVYFEPKDIEWDKWKGDSLVVRAWDGDEERGMAMMRRFTGTRWRLLRSMDAMLSRGPWEFNAPFITFKGQGFLVCWKMFRIDDVDGEITPFYMVGEEYEVSRIPEGLRVRPKEYHEQEVIFELPVVLRGVLQYDRFQRKVKGLGVHVSFQPENTAENMSLPVLVRIPDVQLSGPEGLIAKEVIIPDIRGIEGLLWYAKGSVPEKWVRVAARRLEKAFERYSEQPEWLEDI